MFPHGRKNTFRLFSVSCNSKLLEFAFWVKFLCFPSASAPNFPAESSWMFHLTSVGFRVFPLVDKALQLRQGLIPGRDGERAPASAVSAASTEHRRQQRLADSGHPTTTCAGRHCKLQLRRKLHTNTCSSSTGQEHRFDLSFALEQQNRPVRAEIKPVNTNKTSHCATHADFIFNKRRRDVTQTQNQQEIQSESAEKTNTNGWIQAALFLPFGPFSARWTHLWRLRERGGLQLTKTCKQTRNQQKTPTTCLFLTPPVTWRNACHPQNNNFTSCLWQEPPSSNWTQTWAEDVHTFSFVHVIIKHPSNSGGWAPWKPAC